MNEADQQNFNCKRPGSVIWAGVVFWGLSLGTFGIHILLSRRGVVDPLSFIYAALLLGAALLWLFRPRSRAAFYLGATALVISVIRGALTARTQYLLRAEFPSILPRVAGSLIFTALIAWLAYRYVFGLPSRRYFQLQK